MELIPYYDRPCHTSCKNMKQNKIRTRTFCGVSGWEHVRKSSKFRDIVSYMYNSDCYCYNEPTQVLPGYQGPLFLEVLLEVNAEQCHVFGTKNRYRILRTFPVERLPKSRVTICEKRRSLTCITSTSLEVGNPLFVILYMYNST